MKHFSTVLGTLLLGCVSVMAAEPAPTPAAAHFEVKFLTDMIDHHAMAVMIGAPLPNARRSRRAEDLVREHHVDAIRRNPANAELVTVLVWHDP